MKKIKTSDITSLSAMPFKRGTMEHLQSSYQEVLRWIAIANSQGNYAFAFGGIVAGAKSTLSSGTTYNISAGIVYYNSEFFESDATTLTLTGSNVIVGTITTTNVTAADYDPALFSDGTSYNVHEIRKIVWSNAASGSGTFDHSAAESTRLGNPLSIAYNSAYLIAGAGTWTVAGASDWKMNIITGIGVALTVCFEIKSSTISSSTPYIAITMPFKALNDFYAPVILYTGTTNIPAQCFTQAGDNKLYISAIASNIASGAFYYIKGQITISTVAQL